MKDLIVRNCNLGNDDQTCIYIKKGIIQDIDPKSYANEIKTKWGI